MLQNRDYDDEDYVAGVNKAPTTNKRGPAMAPAAPGSGLVRSGSDISLPATGTLNKRLKNQMGVKQEAAQPRYAGVCQEIGAPGAIVGVCLLAAVVLSL